MFFFAAVRVTLQLRVLCLRLLQNRNIRISIFPQRQKILISGFRFRGVALRGVGARKAEAGTVV